MQLKPKELIKDNIYFIHSKTTNYFVIFPFKEFEINEGITRIKGGTRITQQVENYFRKNISWLCSLEEEDELRQATIQEMAQLEESIKQGRYIKLEEINLLEICELY